MLLPCSLRVRLCWQAADIRYFIFQRFAFSRVDPVILAFRIRASFVRRQLLRGFTPEAGANSLIAAALVRRRASDAADDMGALAGLEAKFLDITDFGRRAARRHADITWPHAANTPR